MFAHTRKWKEKNHTHNINYNVIFIFYFNSNYNVIEDAYSHYFNIYKLQHKQFTIY